MKVLHIHSFDNGGGAETVFNITRANSNNQKNYSGYIKTDNTDSSFPDIQFRIYYSYPKFQQLLNYIFSFHNYFALKKFLKETPVDVIHLHGFIGALSASILLALRVEKKRKKFVVIQTMHDFHLSCPNSILFDYSRNSLCEKCLGKKIKLYSFINSCDRRGLIYSFLKGIRTFISNNLFKHERIIDKFIAPSELMKNKLIVEGISNQKIIVIRNPLPTNEYFNSFDKENSICYFGRFSKEKDIPFIIDFFTSWKQNRENNFKLILVGAGDEKQKILQLVRENQFRKDFVIKDFMPINDLKETIKNCKYIIMASRLYENAPMSILESVSLNIIPIVPDLGGMKEMIDSVVTIGKTYKLGDKESLINCMESLEHGYNEEIKKFDKIKYNIINQFGVDNYLDNLNILYTCIHG